ncbi:MAG: XRE family transcriptional regulator, partial [Spirochaetales bacterium]|nr:XRE family transcriptional regulator [Spirochaetales bacterium]
HRARLTAEREILSIRLADLRERQGIRQSDLKAFTQSAVSKLEKRKDMKISTLIEYLEDIGMGLEIRAYPKSENSNVKAETLLKV